MGMVRAALLTSLLALPLCSVNAQGAELGAEAAYTYSQAAIGKPTLAHILTDEAGQPLSLAALRGQPLLVSLVYTSCATVCPITTDHLKQEVERAHKVLGADKFNVLTFGFDARRDKPAQLAAFAGSHRLAGISGWYIASADAATTAALLQELGFSYRAAAGGIEHVTQTTILDADGVVYRQIYGETFPATVLVEPLKELVLGTRTRSLRPPDLWNRINFLCTVYNPRTGAYRFDYGIFFGIFFGAASLMLSGAIIARLWWQRRRTLRYGPQRDASAP